MRLWLETSISLIHQHHGESILTSPYLRSSPCVHFFFMKTKLINHHKRLDENTREYFNTKAFTTTQIMKDQSKNWNNHNGFYPYLNKFSWRPTSTCMKQLTCAITHPNYTSRPCIFYRPFFHIQHLSGSSCLLASSAVLKVSLTSQATFFDKEGCWNWIFDKMQRLIFPEVLPKLVVFVARLIASFKACRKQCNQTFSNVKNEVKLNWKWGCEVGHFKWEIWLSNCTFGFTFYIEYEELFHLYI